jgi:hypothetical protein
MLHSVAASLVCHLACWFIWCRGVPGVVVSCRRQLGFGGGEGLGGGLGFGARGVVAAIGAGARDG